MKKQTLKNTLFLSVFIVLLFSFLPVAGQDQDGLSIPTGKEVAKTWLRDIEEEYFCVMLLTAYELYEKECYADSTFEIWGGGPDIKIEAVNDTLDYTQIRGVPAIYIERREWTHRDPTFQGFIEFLRKYGQGKKSK